MATTPSHSFPNRGGIGRSNIGRDLSSIYEPQELRPWTPDENLSPKSKYDVTVSMWDTQNPDPDNPPQGLPYWFPYDQPSDYHTWLRKKRAYEGYGDDWADHWIPLDYGNNFDDADDYNAWAWENKVPNLYPE